MSEPKQPEGKAGGPMPKPEQPEGKAPLESVTLPASGVHTPQPHPKLINLVRSAPLLARSEPGDLSAFIAASRSLGRHEGNLLLHSILALSKYPTVVENLTTHFAKLPKQLKAHVGVSRTFAFKG